MRSTLSTVAECTVPEKILLSAADLEEGGLSPFSAEALIVASWQKYPQSFGLKGYVDQYPDSNKVLSSIMGVKGLAGRGWLVKVGQKLYALSRDGRQVIHRLRHGEDAPPPPSSLSRLSREQEKFLNGLWTSTAFEKMQEGRPQELNFSDACSFWGISDDTRGPAVTARMDQILASFADLERFLMLGDATLSSGRSVVPTDVSRLTELHKQLEQRFARHLNLLRSRGGRA